MKYSRIALLILIMCSISSALADDISLPTNGLSLGNTFETVLQSCSENAVVVDNLITDNVSLAGYDYQVEYKFKDGILLSATYCTTQFANESECEDKFNQLNMSMMDTYGLPTAIDDTWGFYAWKPMYENQMGTAMYKGLVSRVTKFDIPGSTVEIRIGKEGDIVKLSALVRKNSDAVFALDSFKADSNYKITQDEMSGKYYIDLADPDGCKFTDQYTKDYYSYIYPDIYCKPGNDKLYPVFRLWISYVSTKPLYIQNVEIKAGDTTWVFKDTRVDLPKQVTARTYQAQEKAVILFGTQSLEFLEELLDYNGDVIVRMTSSNSTDQRTFAMPNHTLVMIKEMYKKFKDANGVNEEFQEQFNANTFEKKIIKTY